MSELSDCPNHVKLDPLCPHCCSVAAVRTYTSLKLIKLKDSLRLTQNEVDIIRLQEEVGRLQGLVRILIDQERRNRECDLILSSDDSNSSSSNDSGESSFSKWLVSGVRKGDTDAPAKAGKRARQELELLWEAACAEVTACMHASFLFLCFECVVCFYFCRPHCSRPHCSNWPHCSKSAQRNSRARRSRSARRSRYVLR